MRSPESEASAIDELNAESLLEDALRQLSSILFSDAGPEGTLSAVAGAAQQLIPACEAASVTLVDQGRPMTPVSTDAAALSVDEVQYSSGAGPCLHAVRSQSVVSVESIARDQRWPEFRTAALSHGFTSSLSLPLQVADETVGALNLYGGTLGAFDGFEDVGAVFARQAAITVSNAQAFHRAAALSEQLALALEHRDVIGQAKGVLMAQSNLDSEQAFDALRRASQRTNRKLYDLAQEIVARRNHPSDGTA